MKIPLNWIRKYTDIVISKEELLERVAERIGEVESVEELGEKYKDILVAEIKEKKDHPEAEKLAVYQVNIGNEVVQVVAGDKTLEVGDKVAYFAPGVAVPYNAKPEKQGTVVERVKLRGIESNGMMASARELDISNNHEIVMRLPKEANPGSSFADLFDLNDAILDVENKALTNRPDCFGMLGIAREISGIQDLQFTTPEWYLDPTTAKNNLNIEPNLPLSVENLAGSMCPRYMAVAIDNVEVKESPIYIQAALVKCGMRPINNIVDITNYLMLLTGQPLHPFDYDKLKSKDPKGEDGAHIVVRPAKDGETITTLDGKTSQLQDSVVMICDSTNPIAVGGVMGGLSTEIDENTKRVVIESASFDMYNIRKTSMKLGLFTEAVTRFSKGQDPNQCETVLYEAIRMIQELAGGEVASEIYDNYEIKKEPKQVTASISKMNAHLGVEFSVEQIEKILNNVELQTSVDGDTLKVDVPTFRNDLNIRQDIHEEVARLSGYNSIALTLPSRPIYPISKNPVIEIQRKVRKIMASLGANEILTYNFMGAKDYEKYGLDLNVAYHIRNPLSPELEYMRTALLPSVAEKVVNNLRAGEGEFVLYEINKAHNKQELDGEGLPYERLNLAIIHTAEEKVAKEKYSGSPFYIMKEYVESLLQGLNIYDVKYQLLANLNLQEVPFWIGNVLPLYDLNTSALIIYKKGEREEILGICGDLSARAKKAADLPQYSSGAELHVETLMNLSNDLTHYREPSRYPAVSHDLCFVLDADVPYGYIAQLAEEVLAKAELGTRVDPVDIYQTDQQDKENKKQVTIRLTLQSREKTLSSKEVEAQVKKVVRKVANETGGVLKD